MSRVVPARADQMETRPRCEHPFAAGAERVGKSAVETQALVAWVREPEQKLLDGASLTRWLAERPRGPWWDLLREAVEQYVADTSGAETPAPHFIEWLAEWGREFRRRQVGVLLLSAHRAKGLEFRHVVVLDGAWDRVGRGEDRDAARRLYYVAMTRAKETLTLLAAADAARSIGKRNICCYAFVCHYIIAH